VLVAGTVLLAWSAAAALVVAAHPRANAVDRWVFDWIPARPELAWAEHVSTLGSLPVVVVGSLAAAAWVVRRDRWRALACLAAPGTTLVLVEVVLKPAVGRRYVGVLSYPSGTVAATAAVACALTVAAPAAPAVVRLAVGVVGAVATGAVAWSVVVLRWHLPTDALAAAVLAVGVVLTAAGLADLVGEGRRRRAASGAGRPPGPGVPTATGRAGGAADLLGSPGGSSAVTR
jgi:membrane-associated phospholipid phosphatase